MNKKRLLFVVSMMATIIICVVVMSFAWFAAAGQQHVGTNGVLISAYDPTVLTIGSKIIQSVGQYKGETGLVFYKYVETNDNDAYVYVKDDQDGFITKNFTVYDIHAEKWDRRTYEGTGASTRIIKYTASYFSSVNIQNEGTYMIVSIATTNNDATSTSYEIRNGSDVAIYTSGISFYFDPACISPATSLNSAGYCKVTPSEGSSLVLKMGSVSSDVTYYPNKNAYSQTTYTKIDNKNNTTGVYRYSPGQTNPYTDTEYYAHHSDAASYETVVYSSTNRTTTVEKRKSVLDKTCKRAYMDGDVQVLESTYDQIVVRQDGSRYRISEKGSPRYDSDSKPPITDEITVTERSITTYAVWDDASLPDQAYSVEQQFYLLLNGQEGKGYYLEFGADVLGVVPETSAAADTLSNIAGVEVGDIYYTYVGTEQGSEVIYGLDSTITGEFTEHERIVVQSYDERYYSVIEISYTPYVDAEDRYFMTENSGDLYYYNEDTMTYTKVTTAVADDVQDVQDQVGGGLNVFVLFGNTYLDYDAARDGDILMAELTLDKVALYHKSSSPVYEEANSSQIIAGTGLYVWDVENEEYVPASSQVIAACQPLFLENGALATDEQIAAGEGLYYVREGANVLATEEELALRTTLYVRVDTFAPATSQQMDANVDLYRRNLTTVVYSKENNAVVYSDSNATIVPAKKTMYKIPSDLFYDYFYIEVRLLDRTDIPDSTWETYTPEERMGLTTTFYPDADGILHSDRNGGEAFTLSGTNRKLYCHIKIYFLDKDTLYGLFDESTNGLEYIYTYSGSSGSYGKTSSGNLVPFYFSDNQYMGSHFVLRIYTATAEPQE